MTTQAEATDSHASIFQSSLPISEKLDRARMELLDLSARNRLLNMPRSSKGAKAIEIVDEKSVEIFRLLAKEGRVFTFLPGRVSEEEAESEEAADLEQPESGDSDDGERQVRHVDTRLQTRLTPKGLQHRLLELFYDARTLEEEQGVNILFLALGALKWIDPQNAANIRYAPLLLLPVSLDRGNAGEKFKLRIRQEEYASNLSLEAFLDRVHGIRLPDFEVSDEFNPLAYMEGVAEAISSKAAWQVLPDEITLGFFSFAKFLMYRDLDPGSWKAGSKISDRPLIRGLLADGFEVPAGMLAEDERIDPHISPAEMVHIVDCDSSQALAIHEVRRGRDLVIQGPPGTGKSQTIANIIATAVADGRTVLFVAEKMAALEVVKRRLDATGVGDACLELHSNKANKRALLEELRRTWELGVPRGQIAGSLHQRLTESRDRLNAHAERMHTPDARSGLTPFQVIGHLVRLKSSGQKPNDIELEDATLWSPDGLSQRIDVLSELVERVLEIGKPANHPWYGVGIAAILPNDVDRLVGRIAEIAKRLAQLEADATKVGASLDIFCILGLGDISSLRQLADRVASAPHLGPDALASNAWTNRAAEIERLVRAGERYLRLIEQLQPVVRASAWAVDVVEARDLLSTLPPGLPTRVLANCAEIATRLPDLLRAAWELSGLLGRNVPSNLAGMRLLIQIADRVSVAPEASAQTFAAELWNTGVERAADIAKAVARLEEARATVNGVLREHAWDLELEGARATLAAYGNGFFRVLSGEWRRSNRLVRGILSRPDQALEDTLLQLDALARGQAARRELRDDADFGQSAFGMHWRGDKSASGPLQALVEWMRSLKGLGAEPRIIAAKGPDRTRVANALARVRDQLRLIEPHISTWFESLGEARQSVFGDSVSHETAELPRLLTHAASVASADSKASSVCDSIPTELNTLVTRLTALIDLQSAISEVRAEDDLGRSVFGDIWLQEQSNWLHLREGLDWVSANAAIRVLAGRFNDRKAVANEAKQIEVKRDALVVDLRQIANYLHLDVSDLFAGHHLHELPFSDLLNRLNLWSRSGEEITRWVAYRDRAKAASSMGCADVVERISDGDLAPNEAIPAFEMAYFEALFADIARRKPEIGRFDGTLHGRLAKEFAEMDRQMIALSSVEVARSHHRKVPARDGGGNVGPLGVLRSEIQKKRAHMPIRRLMERAAPAVLALKPVFMMSPLSVAQFLPPYAMEFDLLVMDEASQIHPVDALGAVARTKQVVVVGDPKQLPPTAFFAKMTGTVGEDDDEDTTRVGDIESILGLFTARGLPTRMLRWHYRSKHESLIAVSNRQFYENKLYIVPSPFTSEAGMGLRFHHVPNGLFDAGGTRANVVEARLVAEAIAKHAEEAPTLSLGVAAFSAAQRRAIVDQLEIIRRTLPPQVENFFQQHASEPFFVKNLENVQGDERDVIFISVGYGPTVAGGRPPMRFGPLSQDGGERRLNVLISRAKRRCEVFASMTDEQIDPDFAATRKGVFAFRMFLHYARTGRLSISERVARDKDAVFEEQVANALQSRGYQVHRQVGLAGLFIDLAIADESRPGKYLLGIDCDGASYHESRSARDRDRLRQSVLESHGWTIHKIWSADWLHRPEEQIQLVISRIESAKAEFDAASAKPAPRPLMQIVSIDREGISEIELTRQADPTVPNDRAYIQAVPRRPAHRTEELHDTPTGLLSALAEEVVAIEGPVHVDEVVDRIKEAWGLKRAGARIQSAVAKAIAVSVKMGRLNQNGAFLVVPSAVVLVRDRSEAASPSLKRAEMLPPAEIRVAIVEVVKKNLGASVEQIIPAVSRSLGIKATSAQVKQVIVGVLDDLVKKGDLIDQAGIVVCSS